MARMVKLSPESILWRVMAQGHRLWCVELWAGFDQNLPDLILFILCGVYI